MASFICHALKLSVLVIALGWIGLLFVTPTKQWEKPLNTLNQNINSSFFGQAGTVHLLYGAPVFLLAILASIYLHIYKNQPRNKSKFRQRADGLVRYPLIIRGPLGSLNIGEFLLLILGLFMFVWTTTQYILTGLDEIDQAKIPPGFTIWQRKWGLVAGRVGAVGSICLATLFFPVTRGSVFLQLLNISFETSVKYHIWIANLAMSLFTLHGLTFMVIWGYRGIIWEKLFSWHQVGYSFMAGTISLVSGLIMWITAMKPIRKRWFEVFYYTHHLYIPFIVFFAFHVGNTLFALALPGIFLFFLDRYLRLLQSRKMIDVIAARKIPCRMVQLVVAKHPSLEYNPTSIILLKLPTVSKLEWHPFSIISTSSVDSDRFSILIKCRHSWTEKLESFIKDITSIERPIHLAASIEGPYGPAYNDFLGYHKLILIGGGSGITPLMSILTETLHRHNTFEEEEEPLPKEITLLWAIRESEELGVLTLISPSKICPNYSDLVKLDIQAYVTRERPSVGEMVVYPGNAGIPSLSEVFYNEDTAKSPRLITGNVSSNSVSSISGPNSTLWQAAIIFSSLAGYFLLMGMVDHVYIYPIDHNSYQAYPWWARTLLSFVCMSVGIVIFGGLVFVVWNRKKCNKLGPQTKDFSDLESYADDVEHQGETLLTRATVHRGQRPNIQGIIGTLSAKMEGSSVGVIVCGPEKLKEDVALSCKQHNRLSLGTCSPNASINLHFHSLTFEF